MAINSGTFSSKIWKTTHLTLGLGIGVTVLGAMLLSRTDLRAASAAIEPATMASIGSIEERFQAYNVEMLEVTGGRFLKPYRNLEAGSRKRENASTPAGMNPDLYEHRAPIDLTNSRLRKLAAVLGPTYVRVSGTWANTTHFYNSDGSAPKTPPKGFSGVLTREQWRRVICRPGHGKIAAESFCSPNHLQMKAKTAILPKM